MTTIYKYPLPVADRAGAMTLEVHQGAVPLFLGVANDEICVWFQVKPDAPEVERVIYVRGTGQELSGIEGPYIGSIIQKANRYPNKDMVWHYFDQLFDFSKHPWEVSVTETRELEAWEEETLRGVNPAFPETTALNPSKN